ncbi:hypothetical protein NSTC731_06127 [Nostoc sp. DSM 114167]|jgi:hypothetical protein
MMGYFLTASTLNAAGLNAQDIAVLFLSRYRLNLYFDICYSTPYSEDE